VTSEGREMSVGRVLGVMLIATIAKDKIARANGPWGSR
jgi:hypothetical protein